MIRRTSKIALEIAGVAVAVTAVLLAVLAWRLSSGPVSISVLNRMVEDAARPSLQGGDLAIGDTILIWAAEERELSLRLSDVELKGADGNEIAHVPQLAFELSVPALFRGMLAPTSIDLYGVSATVLRRPGTGITLALAGVDEAPQSDTSFVGPMLEALLDETDRSSPLGYLSRFGIKQAKLRFVDEVNGVSFEAPSANLMIFRGDGGIAGLLNASFAVAETMAHLELNGFLPANGDAARIDVTASDIVPAALARVSPAFEDYAIFDAPLFAEGELSIKRDGELKSAQLTLQSGTGKINLPEPWNTSIPLEKAQAKVNIDGEARQVAVKEMAFKAGPHEASLSGTIGYTMGEGLNIAGISADLSSDSVHTEVPGFFVGPLDLERLHVDADIDFDALTAKIDELFIGTGGGGIRLSGTVADAERSPAVAVTGKIEPMPFDAMTAIWPIPLAKGAREWVGKNLSGGMLTGGSFDIDLAGGMIADAADHIAIPKDRLHFEFFTSGQTMKYLGELPPMENLEAHGLIEGNRFDAWVSSAVIRQEGLGDIAVSDGHFYDDELHRKGALGHIRFTVAGATADILSVLDRDPLNLMSAFGLDPQKVAGSGRLTGALSLPLVKGVTMQDVDFSGTGHAEDVAIPNIQENLSVTSGSLDVEVTRAGLTASGPISLNNATDLDLEWREHFSRDISPRSSYRLRGPLDEAGRMALGLKLDQFIEGIAVVDATLMGDGRSVNRGSIRADLTGAVAKFADAGWSKPAGEPAMTQFDLAMLEDGGYRISDFRLTGDDIDTRGTFTLGDGGRLIAADFPAVKLGEHNDFTFKAGPSENAALSMEVEGQRFDARGVLSEFLAGNGEEAATAGGEPPVVPDLLTEEVAKDPLRRTVLTAEIARATGHNETSFNDVAVRLVQVDGRTWSMNLSAASGDGKPVALRIGPDTNGARSLDMSSNDAGTIFRALDFTRSIRGGTLKAAGKYDDAAPGSPLSGTLSIDKFRIVNAPVLANILTVGSLTGISDTMRGEGIFFERLELPFAFTESRIHVKDARMSGPAIGLTMEGQIDRAEDLVDMEGTLVPAYTINSFLGNVPVLGPLIVGREGEGIFAITYSVRGKADDPTVVVNPLSAIAPGFLRRIFEFGNTLPPEAKKDAIPQTGDPVTPETIAPAAESPVQPQDSSQIPGGQGGISTPVADEGEGVLEPRIEAPAENSGASPAVQN